MAVSGHFAAPHQSGLPSTLSADKKNRRDSLCITACIVSVPWRHQSLDIGLWCLRRSDALLSTRARTFAATHKDFGMG